MNENDLREALAAIAGEPPAPPRELPVELGRRARRRQAPRFLVGAAALVAGAIGLASVLSDGSTVDTRPAAGPPPPDLVATTLSGAVVVVSTEDGRVLRTLAPDTSADGVVARSPDGEWVYFSDHMDPATCRQALYRVRAAGGTPPERIGEGTAPAVSPDGTRVAFAGFGSGCATTLVVRTLATGEERSWAPPERGGAAVHGLRWSPDGRRLVLDLGLPYSPVYVLDTEEADALDDARPVADDLHAPAWLPDGRLVALRTVTEGDRVREEVVVVDPATGEASPVVGAPVDAATLDVDPSGRFLVVVNRRGDLFLRADDGPLRRLDGGFRTTAW